MKMFGNFNFGPVYSNIYKMSHLGLAVVSKEGRVVSYDKSQKEIVDVDMIDFDAKGMVFAMPSAIKDIKVGDVILHQNAPMFVESVDEGIKVVDISVGERKEIMPAKSMFGFNFVTKIVSLFEGMAGEATADSPFGNMLPMMMMMGNNSDDSGENNIMQSMMMMQLMGGSTQIDTNMMMMMAMMNQTGGSKDNGFFQMMMLNQLVNPQTAGETAPTV